MLILFFQCGEMEESLKVSTRTDPVAYIFLCEYENTGDENCSDLPLSPWGVVKQCSNWQMWAVQHHVAASHLSKSHDPCKAC